MSLKKVGTKKEMRLAEKKRNQKKFKRIGKKK
jgi:hypothetical protein